MRGVIPQQPLVLRTIDLLQSRPPELTYQTICEDTGLRYSFIRALARNSTEDYGANRIQILYEYLSKRKLELA